MTARDGYRGYISSRPILGNSTPQKVQQLVIRDYCRRHGLRFLLSATEYVMPGCYLMLDDVLNELPTLGGIVAYSLFMLPQRAERRQKVYERILDTGASLHFALEDVRIFEQSAIAAIEDIWLVNEVMHGRSHTPIAEDA